MQDIKICNLDKRTWIVHFTHNDANPIKVPPSTHVKLQFGLLGSMNTCWNGIQIAMRKTVLMGIPEWSPEVIYLVPKKYAFAFAEHRRRNDHPNDSFTHGEKTEITELICCSEDDDSDNDVLLEKEKEEVLICYDGLMQEI
jgi:hypothetical protein